MKRTNQVFALGGIDTGFAANRRIHLRQQRGWDLHETDPAPQHGGGKANQITDDTAA